MSRSKFPPGMKAIVKDGRQGYFLRVTGMCPVKRKIVQREVTLWEVTEEQALAEREKIYREILAGGPSAKDRLPTLGEYAKSWLERNAPHIRSANTLSRYQDELVLHILPHFGEWVIDKIRKPDLEQWLATCAKAKYEIRSGRKTKRYSPASINGWFRLLKGIVQSAAADFELPDPTRKVRPLPEDPVEGNTLETKERLEAFLMKAKELTPQWYAMMVLGFAIGARKGELRPIIKHEDLDFETGHLVIRKSQRRGYLGPTKSRKARHFFLPKNLIDILRWHVDYLKQIGHPQANGPLLFPSYGGWRPSHSDQREWQVIDPETKELRKRMPSGIERWSPEFMKAYQRERRRLDRARKRMVRSAMYVKPTKPSELHYLSPSCLEKPMEIICEAMGLKERFSSKVMRRTFNDLARAVGIPTLIIRNMAGWQEETTQDRYTTVQMEEFRSAIALVLDQVGGDKLVPKPFEPGTVDN